jgi:DNA polymerase III subunit beta
MKLKLSKDATLEALQNIQSVVSARTTLPILQNILLKADAEKVWFSATDLEVSVRVGLAAEVSKPGATTLPARRILSIFKELPANEIEIEVDDQDTAAICSGSSFFKLIGISEDEFPPLPKFEGGRTYTLDQGVFKAMIQSTSYAASTEESRYILNGLLLSFKGDKLAVVATDGRRMALFEQEIEFPKGSEGDMVLPSKTVDELLKTLHTEGPLKIQATENQIAFEFDEMLIVSKLIEGTYPNFRQVIPPQSAERIPVEREALFSAIRRVTLIADDKSNSVKLTFGKSKLEVSAISQEVGEAREMLDVKYAGKPFAIAFNPQFLMDPLRTLARDEIYLELTDDLSPCVVKSDIPFLYVLMPLRTN